MTRVKRIFGHLSKMRFGALRYRVDRPDLSHLPEPSYDWDDSVCGRVEEIIPHDSPKPLGNIADAVTWVDANLLHDLISGKSVSGILHMVNKTVIDWTSL